MQLSTCKRGYVYMWAHTCILYTYVDVYICVQICICVGVSPVHMNTYVYVDV